MADGEEREIRGKQEGEKERLGLGGHQSSQVPPKGTPVTELHYKKEKKGVTSTLLVCKSLFSKFVYLVGS